MITLQMQLKDHGTITMTLQEDIAPLAVKSLTHFVSLQKYDNVAIQRLEKDFVIQPIFEDGFDAEMDVLIEGEFLTVEQNHATPFRRGTVAMAGTQDQASGSQFFICLQPEERLNGHFTIIGMVTDGWAEIERLEQVALDECKDEASGFVYHRPAEPQVVEWLRVENDIKV